MVKIGVMIMRYILLLLFSLNATGQTIKNESIVERMFHPSVKQSSDNINIGLAASVGSNELTIELKQLDGSTNPTALQPSVISFRKPTVTDGGFDIVKVTGALSITIPASTTIGTISGVAEPIYVYLINNAGTAELAVSVSASVDEGNVISTTAVSGGTSRTTVYSTTARTDVPIRLIGKIVSTQATAGTWATSPSLVVSSNIEPVNVFSSDKVIVGYVAFGASCSAGLATTACTSSPCTICSSTSNITAVTKGGGNGLYNVVMPECSGTIVCAGQAASGSSGNMTINGSESASGLLAARVGNTGTATNSLAAVICVCNK
jgi:hypothetical protein